MEINAIFVDTSMFKALLDVEDDFHQHAARVWETLRKRQAKLVTTNFILDESYTLIRKRCGFAAAQLLRLRLFEDWRSIQIVRVTIQDEADAWVWFQKNWSNLSFTDCISFAVMKRLNLSTVATFDRHFIQAEFSMVEPSK